MRRGDVVVAAARGQYSGKPRPAIIVQADVLNQKHSSLIVAPLTSELRGLRRFRVPVDPTPENGLRVASEIMVDRISPIPRENVRDVIGRLDEAAQVQLDRALLLVLGLA